MFPEVQFDVEDQGLGSPEFEDEELEESTEEEEEKPKPASPRKHMAEMVQEVMDQMKEAEAVSPASGGVPVTTPKRSPSPRRPTTPGLGEETPPDLEESSDEGDALSPESRKFKMLEDQPELIDRAYGYVDVMGPQQQKPPTGSPRTPRHLSPKDAERIAQMQYEQLAGSPKRPSPAVQQAMAQLERQKSPARPSPAQMVQDMPGQPVEAHAEIIERDVIIVQDPFGGFEEYMPPPGLKPKIRGIAGWTSPEEYRTPPSPPVQIIVSPPTETSEKGERIERIGDIEEDYVELTPSSAYTEDEDKEEEEEEIVEEEQFEGQLDEIVSPFKEMVEQHEYTEGFFDPDRPAAQKFILTGSKKRVIKRKAPPPGVSPIREDVEEFLQLPSPARVSPAKPGSPYKTPSPKTPSRKQATPSRKQASSPRAASPAREEIKRAMDYYIAPEHRPFIDEMAAKVADIEGAGELPYYVPYEEPAEGYVAFGEVPEKRPSPRLPDYGHVQDPHYESPPEEYAFYGESPKRPSPVIPHGISPDVTPPDEDYFDDIEPDIEIDMDSVQLDDGQIPADAEFIPAAAPVSPLRMAAEMIADIAMGLTPEQLATSPVRTPPMEFSPDSPYRSPLMKWMDFIEDIYMKHQVPEPKEHFVAGISRKGTRRIPRHSAPPQLSPVMDVPEDYAEEYLPFRKQVFKAPGKIERRPFQFQKGGLRPAAKPGLETWPEQIEYDASPTGTRISPTRRGSPPPYERRREKRKRVRKQLTKKRLDFDDDSGEPSGPRQEAFEGAPLFPSPKQRIYEDLPPAPEEYLPEDLMGAAQTISSETIIETTEIYEELPKQLEGPDIPLQPQIPGWRTPEKYKRQRKTSPELALPPIEADLAAEQVKEFYDDGLSPPATEFDIDVSIELEYEPSPVRTPPRAARRSPAGKPSPFLTPTSPRTPQRTPPKRDVVPMDVERLDQIEMDDLLSPESPDSPMGRPEDMQEMLKIVRESRFKAERKPMSLYGYGEREPIELRRKAPSPKLRRVREEASPFDTPPPQAMPVLSPQRRKRTPPPSQRSPDYWLELAEVERVQLPQPPVFDRQSPQQSPGQRVTTKTVARKLVFDESDEGEAAPAPASPRRSPPRERLEAKIEDVQIEISPGGALLPEPEIMLAISPGADLEAVGPEFAPSPHSPQRVSPRSMTPSPRRRTPSPSPRTPPPRTPKSPVLPDRRSPARMEVTPPSYESPVESPPPPQTPPYKTPPRIHPSPGSPDYSPEEFERLVREHEYTLHQYDVHRKFLTDQLVVGGKKISVRPKPSQQPRLMPVYEREREGGSPVTRTPPRVVPEAQMVPISPPPPEAPQSIEQIQAEAERQYRELAEEVVAAISPHIPPEYEYILEEIVPDQRHIMDVYEREAAVLPQPITDAGGAFVSPPRPERIQEPQLPRVSPRQQPQASPPQMYESPVEEYVPSPESELFDQPADQVDVLTVSPMQYESPPSSPEQYDEDEYDDEVPSPYLSYTPPLYEPPSPQSPIDSPSFMSRIREHQYTRSFFEPGRPEAIQTVKSGRRNVRLYQKYGPGDLEPVVEQQEERPVVTPQRLKPGVYPTAAPRSAERAGSPVFEAVRHEPLRPTHYAEAPQTPKRQLEGDRKVRRKTPAAGRRLDFEEAERGSPRTPVRSPGPPERARTPMSARRKLAFEEEGQGLLVNLGGDMGAPLQSPQRRPVSPRASPRRSPAPPASPRRAPSPRTPQKRSPSPKPSPRAAPSPRRPKSPSPLRRSPPSGGSPKKQASPKTPHVEKTVTTHTTIEHIPGVTPEELNLEQGSPLSPWAEGLDKSYIEEDMKDFKWLDY